MRTRNSYFKRAFGPIFGAADSDLEHNGDHYYYYKHVAFLSLVLGCLIILPYTFYELANTGSFVFLYYGDYNVQQIPFYEHCVRMVHGFDLGWDWTTDLGSNFVGSYSYYLLGSPFFWIMCMFPAAWAPYLMGPIYILKFVVAGLTSFAYLKRFVKNKDYAVIGALLYAFSGFQIYNIFFNQFQEVVALFPLLLIGMEELTQNNRKGVFAIAVALNCMCNYFMFAGQVVFCVIYFFARCAHRSFRITLKRFLLLFFESVLGVLLGAILFLPAALAIMGNYRLSYSFADTKAMLMYMKSGKFYIERYGHILQSLFFPPDIPSRVNFFYGHTTRWASNAAWIPLFGLSGVFAYIKCRKKSALGWLVVFLIGMSLVPVLNSTFFLFNSNYYARWMYMLVMIGLVCTIIALDRENVNWSFGIALNTAFIAGITTYCGLRWFLDTEQDGTVYKLGGEPFPLRLWASVGIALASMLFLFFLIKRYRGTRVFSRVLIVAVCVIIAAYGNIHIGSGKNHSSNTQTIVNTAINGDIELDDDSFYRIDFFRTEDMSVTKATRYECTVTAVADGKITLETDHTDKFSAGKTYSAYTYSTYTSKVKNLKEGAEVKAVESSGDTLIITDSFEVSPAVGDKMTVAGITSSTLDYTNVYDNLGISWEERSVECFHSVVPSSIMNFYEAFGVTRNVGSRADYKKYGLLGFLSVKYSLIRSSSSKHLTSSLSNADGSTYYYANGLDFTYLDTQNEYKIYENENYIEPGFWYDTFITESEFEKVAKSNRHTLICKYLVVPDADRDYYAQFMKEAVSGNTLEEGQVERASANYLTYEKSVAELRKNTCDSFEYTSYSISATATLAEDNVVVFSVPYEKGWTARVNGKAVDVKLVTYGFMAVECSGAADGHYDIEFTYETPGLRYGAIISGAGIVIFVIYMLIAEKKKFRPTYKFFKEDYTEIECPEYEDTAYLPEAAALIRTKKPHGDKLADAETNESKENDKSV